jgi:hypothetical protein
VEPLSRTIVDPEATSETREWLARYAASPGDPAVIPALREAAEQGLAPLQPIGEALERLGAHDEAIAVYARALVDADPAGQVAQRLGWMDAPAAGTSLLARFRDAPTPAIARALGWYALPEVVDALLDAAATPELRLAAIDGLERMPGSRSLDALAALSRRGDVLALRALARRRDRRALAPLLALLDDEEIVVRRQAADGLRDLRDLEAAPALLAAVRRGGDQDLVATAAHALVSMRAPEAADALELLHASADPELRRLGELWDLAVS